MMMGIGRTGRRLFQHFRSCLQKLSQLIRDDAQADGREEVDGETRVAHIVPRQQPSKHVTHVHVIQSRLELGDPQLLAQLLAQDFDEDARGGAGVGFVESDHFQTRPGQRIREEQMRKELGHVPQFVGFQAMDVAVLGYKEFVKGLLELALQQAKALAHQTVVFQIRALLTAAFDDHGANLLFLSRAEVEFQQFVRTFFMRHTRHDGQVDGPSQVDHILLTKVLNLHWWLIRRRLILRIGTII